MEIGMGCDNRFYGDAPIWLHTIRFFFDRVQGHGEISQPAGLVYFILQAQFGNLFNKFIVGFDGSSLCYHA